MKKQWFRSAVEVVRRSSAAAACMASLLACSGRPPGVPAGDAGTVQAGNLTFVMPPPKKDDEELGPRLKKATTMIKAAPPKEIAEVFSTMSARMNNPIVAEFLKSIAEGGHGSGFVVHLKLPEGDRELVVTNKHVVEWSDTTSVILDGGASLSPCPIEFTHPEHDLAILSFPSDMTPVGWGLVPYKKQASEQQRVVAIGYPGILGKPAYRITEGQVSNPSFQPEGSKGEDLIMHTASINPGNSGGPLVSQDGQLVGVNVALSRSENNVFFAVPSGAVVATIQTALDVMKNKKKAPWMEERLGEECRKLVDEMNAAKPKLGVLEHVVGNRFVAEQRQLALETIGSSQELRSLFIARPMDGMRLALIAGLHTVLQRNINTAGSCEIFQSDKAQLTQADKPIRTKLLLKNGRDGELGWVFEHGRWRLASFGL